MLYLGQVRRHAKFLSAGEEHELALAAKAGDASARERLICSQLPYVIHIAKRFLGRGIPLEDLIQLGNQGLIRAADKFDPQRTTRGVSGRQKKRAIRFSTYADCWIRQFMRREIETSAAIIRVPTRTNRDRRGTTKDQADFIFSALSNAVRIDAGCKIAREPAAREPDADAQDVAERFELLRPHLAALSDHHRTILLRRAAGETFLEIGDSLGRTREAIRQAEVKALKILRDRLGVTGATGRPFNWARKRRRVKMAQ